MSSLIALAATGVLFAQALPADPWLIPALPVSRTQQRLKQLEAEEAARWRIFCSGSDQCAYRWTSWKLDPSTGIRTTRKRCNVLGESLPSPNSFEEVAVDCARLRVGPVFVRLSSMNWLSSINWKFPEGPDREMVIALCDSVASAGKRVR